jgi:quercetin dioxygenase-like cupin family protein
VALTADSILARSTRRRQTSTGWNTAYIGANRYTLPPKETRPADEAPHPMAFLVKKGPGAVTRPHFHQADQFQVVVAGRGMLGDRDFSDGTVHYTITPTPTRPMDRS